MTGAGGRPAVVRPPRNPESGHQPPQTGGPGVPSAGPGANAWL